MEDIEALMCGKKAHMLFTDPPWNVNYTGKNTERKKIIGDNVSANDFEKFLDKVLSNISNSLIDGASVYIVMAFSSWEALTAATNKNYKNSCVIIWDKVQFVLSWADYHNQYEPIWYGWKKAKKRLHPVKLRNQSNIWRIKKNNTNKIHPTQKPVDLIEKAILNSTNEGDIVVDLFGGSGSTLIACEKTNRICYTMEIDQEYCNAIIKRFNEHT